MGGPILGVGRATLPKSQLTCRLYVLLELYRLRHSYISLTKRTRALRTAKPTVTVPEAEGYELTPLTSDIDHQGEDTRDEKALLRTEWAAWKNATLVNS